MPAWFGPTSSARRRRTAIDSGPHAIFAPKVDVDTIADLRVVEWDDASSSAKLLQVHKEGNQWTIPSKFGYPADANDRVSRTAQSFLGLRKERLVTDDSKQFADLGVVDPLDPNLSERTGRGKRVTMTDVTGKIVADLILGKRDEAGEGVYFMREADKNEVYTVTINPDLSTKFVDYVEADPLKIEKREDITDIDVADYSVDLKSRDNQAAAALHHPDDLKRQGTSDVWSATDRDPARRQAARPGRHQRHPLRGQHRDQASPTWRCSCAAAPTSRGPWHLLRWSPGRSVDQSSPVLPFMDGSSQAKNYEIVGTEGVSVDLTTRNGRAGLQPDVRRRGHQQRQQGQEGQARGRRRQGRRRPRPLLWWCSCATCPSS